MPRLITHIAMSKYQYYEFQTIDRPLNEQEREAIQNKQPEFQRRWNYIYDKYNSRRVGLLRRLT